MPGGHSSRSFFSSDFGDLRRILIRHQPEAEFRAGFGRQDGFRAFALIAACQPVDGERRPR